MTELSDLYDEKGRLTGETAIRGEEIPQGRFRLVVGVLCLHQDGDVLLMQRHPDKPTHPGVFEASVSGSALAGETAQQAALRELYEETGLKVDHIQPLYEDRDEKHLYQGFLVQVACEKNSIRLQAGETVAYRWVSRGELKKMQTLKPCPIVLQKGVLRYLGLMKHPSK